MSETHADIRLSPADAAGRWGAELSRSAGQARAEAQTRLGLDMPGPVHVVSFPSEWEFNQYLRARPAHAVAVARANLREIVINRRLWFRMDVDDQRRTLVHEMCHLILGRMIDGDLPAWLDEGMAMLTAREDLHDSVWRVMIAGTFGNLLHLEELMGHAPFGGSAQSLAYAQSLSVTRFLIKRSFPDVPGSSEDPALLAGALADPATGPALRNRLGDHFYIRALDSQWRTQQKSLWTVLATLSGGAFLWAVLSVFFLLAYWRKQRLARLKRERFGAEEQRDRELGLEPPPWEYAAGEDPDDYLATDDDDDEDDDEDDEERER